MYSKNLIHFPVVWHVAFVSTLPTEVPKSKTLNESIVIPVAVGLFDVKPVDNYFSFTFRLAISKLFIKRKGRCVVKTFGRHYVDRQLPYLNKQYLL